MPGHVFLRLAPNGLADLAAGLPDGIAAVSATNGKTTTSAMLSHILSAENVVCRNAAGANLMSGVVTTLLHQTHGATVGALEIDEAALPAVAANVGPRVIALGNLFRDQLDRHGELELVADRWRAMVAGLPEATTLVLCADDPVIDALGRDRANVVRYGIDDPSVALAVRDEAADSTFCVHCGAAYVYDAVYLGHLGAYRCPSGDHERGALQFAARAVRPLGTQGTAFRLDAPDGGSEVLLPLPGLYNVENALAAIATAHVLGVPTAVAVARLASFRAAFGRFERIEIQGRDVVLILFKNPTGANEALRAIAPDVAGSHVVLDERKQVLAIREALVQFDEEKNKQPFVEVETTPQSFTRHDVKLGLSDGITTEVLSGVSKGDHIKIPSNAGPAMLPPGGPPPPPPRK